LSRLEIKNGSGNGRHTVAVLGTLPPLKGLSSYCLEFAKALSLVSTVKFISFKSLYPAWLYPGGQQLTDNSFPSGVCDGIEVSIRLTWYNPATWMRVGRKTDADLLHAQWWSLPLFPVFFCICCLFKIRKKPVVITIHNVIDHSRSSLYSFFSGILYKLGDHFIVHTRQNMKQLTECFGISTERITVIPHGPLDFFKHESADRIALRSEYGIGEHETLLLLFGAIRPYKGIKTALKAFQLIQQEIPDCRLMIAGRLWEDWAPYQELIRELNISDSIITVLDYIPSSDVHVTFTMADLVLLPYTHFDSQSGVGATAVSFRKPLIVSDTGGLPDLVENKGYIVPPGDPGALSCAVLKALKSPGELSKMARDADASARDMSWESIAEKTYAVYDRVCK